MARIVKFLFVKAINWLDLRNNTLTTYRVKSLEINHDLISRNSRIFSRYTNVGIVIQGQIIPNLTLKICARYKSLYPNANIVVSTWEDQRKGDVDQIRHLGVYLIENKLPKHAGPANVNLQIASTKAGIEFCAAKGSEYILKNRSDGCLSSDYFLQYLMFLFDSYTLNGNRIVVPSYNSFLFRLYSPSDQFQFGTLEDLRFFWDCNFVNERTKDFRFAESYLLRNYLSRKGIEVKNTIEDSLAVYRDHFIVAENSELGLVLNKGTKQEVSNRWANDGFPQPMSEMRFWHWLDLQKDLSAYLSHYEGLPFRPVSGI